MQTRHLKTIPTVVRIYSIIEQPVQQSCFLSNMVLCKSFLSKYWTTSLFCYKPSLDKGVKQVLFFLIGQRESRELRPLNSSLDGHINVLFKHVERPLLCCHFWLFTDSRWTLEKNDFNNFNINNFSFVLLCLYYLINAHLSKLFVVTCYFIWHLKHSSVFFYVSTWIFQ